MKYFCSLSLCPNSCFYMNLYLCISFKYRFKNPLPKPLLFSELCSLLQKQVFVRPCNAVLYNTKALGFFFYPLIGLQDAEDKSHSHFFIHSWLSLSGVVYGTGFNGHSLHFLLPNDMYDLNVTDWLFWNFSLNWNIQDTNTRQRYFPERLKNHTSTTF